MKRVSARVISGVSNAALAISGLSLAAVAQAQTGPDRAAASTQAATSVPEDTDIVVTGIRAGLKTAIDLKRSSDVVADVIAAEDIGKFPDTNLAESLQRITGVQITRNRGEGSNVSIRGLDPAFNRVELNGRSVTSPTGGRNFDFTILASDFVSAIEVYKTPSADREEGGIAGTINVRTARPLDLGKNRLALSAEAVYESNPKETQPKLSLLANHVFDDGRFGVNFGVSWERRALGIQRYEAFGLESATESTRSPQLDYNRDGDFKDTFLINHAANFNSDRGRTERGTAVLNLQFKPTPELDLHLDTLASYFDERFAALVNANRFTNIAGPGAAVINSVIDPAVGGGLVTFLDANGVDHRVGHPIIANRNRLYSIALGGTWKSGDLQIDSELSYSRATRSSDYLQLQTISRGNTAEDLRGNLGAIPSVTYGRGYDPLNPSTYYVLGINGFDAVPTTDTNKDFRIDGTYRMDGFVKAIRLGFKYSDRLEKQVPNSIAISAQQLAPLVGATYLPTVEGGAFAAAPFLTQINYGNFLPGYPSVGPYPTTYLAADIEKFYGTLSKDKLLSTFAPAPNLAGTFSVKERVPAAYLRVDFGTADDRFGGNIGVRYVHTSQTSEGYAPDLNNIIFSQLGAITTIPTVSAQTIKRSYDNVLPSLNLKYSIADNVVMRFGLARVMSRPTLSLLSPSTSVNANVRTINSNNPLVKPYLTDQADLSLEWYLKGGGLLSVAGFYKDLKNFIVSTSRTETLTVKIDTGGTLQIPFTRFLPDNGAGSKLKGFEIGYQQPFTFFGPFFRNFGVIANYTYVEADPVSVVSGGPPIALPGVSKNNYNLVGYYEDKTVGVRLAYNFRDRFVVDTSSYFGDGDFVNAYRQLDLSASLNLTAQIQAKLDILNLTNSNLVNVDKYGALRGVQNVGRRFTFGVRASF